MLNSAELSMKKVLIVGSFIFMTKWNFMLSWVEHEKGFHNLGAWLATQDRISRTNAIRVCPSDTKQS